jgi:histidinol-phosphate aminotransferase
VSESYQRATPIDDVRRRIGSGRRIVRLASNENPLGTSPKALAALQDVRELNRYGDDSYLEMRERLAVRHGLRLENVVLGHGSNEIVKLAAEAFLSPGDEAIVAVPSFLLYRLAVSSRGGVAVEVPLRDGVTDLDAMLAAVTPRTKLVFVCEPNNPTATAVSQDAWRAFTRALPARIALVVDQAYREYAAAECVDASGMVRERPNTIVLRTMSKIYGLAALRFGYGFAGQETVAELERIRLPFNVSAPALAGAMAALGDDEFLARSIENNEAQKRALFPALERLALQHYPTQTNFYALAVPVSATKAHDDLLHEGIIVRSGDALRMPGRLRITIGSKDENDALVAALERLVERWAS